jgi:hypothetical protein
VSIELHCESCGKLVKAPRDAAGKQGKCPYCGNSMYIPSPPEELEELPLAPEDRADLEREAALQAERRRLDRVLAEQDAEAGEAGAGGGSRSASGGVTTITVEEGVLAYLAAMRNSDLVRAEKFLALLQQKRAEARDIVDRLASDQIPPTEMAGVPSGVYQGFLKSLRSHL